MNSQENSNNRIYLIIDSSTIITLYELKSLNLLKKLRSKVKIIIPIAVKRELSRGAHGIRVNNISSPIVELNIKEVRGEIKALLEGLGNGEREAIEIAYSIIHEGECDKVIVVTDDFTARQRCKRLGIPVMGTLGLIDFAKRRRIITKNRALEIIDSIPSTSLYITQELLRQVKEKIMHQNLRSM